MLFWRDDDFYFPGPAAYCVWPHPIATASHAAAHHTLASIQGLVSEVRWHAVRGAAHAAPASEAQSHSP
jgi:hypothetical protein